MNLTNGDLTDMERVILKMAADEFERKLRESHIPVDAAVGIFEADILARRLAFEAGFTAGCGIWKGVGS